MERRRYTDDERANALAALAANGNNIPLTARQLGIPHKTLRQWFNGLRHPEAAQMSNEKKPALIEKLKEIAEKLLDSVSGKISDARLSETMTSFGIAVDKMLLLTGEPTEISESRNVSEQPIDAEALNGFRENIASAGMVDVSTNGTQKPVDHGTG